MICSLSWFQLQFCSFQVRMVVRYIKNAKKGKELNFSERKIILYLHKQGKSTKYICDMFNRCRQTIENVIKRSKDPKSLILRNERKILQENRQNRHLAAPKLN